MTMTLLDDNATGTQTLLARRLQESTAAARVSLRWLGVRKTLTNEQKSQAAESFGAEGDFLSARKKLIDTRHDAYKAVVAVRGSIISYWKSESLPYPEPGIRLIHRNRINRFTRRMQRFRQQLHAAVESLDQHFEELKAAAQRRLGSLYNPSDYPPSLVGMFDVEVDFPNMRPPDYLSHLNPEIYAQEHARMVARFEQAVELAEQAFIGEFAKLVQHLTERLGNEPDGTRRVFRDTVVTNLTDFFNRFRQLSVRSNADLDALVERAQQLVQGVEPQNLRDDAGLRSDIAQQMAAIQSQLDPMIVDRPRRRIIRNHPPDGEIS